MISYLKNISIYSRTSLVLLLLTNILLSSQQECLELVYKEARKYTKYPSTLVAIAMTESSCGLHLVGDDGDSLGLMQMQVPTVRYIASKDSTLSWVLLLNKKAVKTLLVRKDKVSIMLASKLFEFYRKRYGYFQAISRYNGGKRNYTYYNRVSLNKQRLLALKTRR